MQYLQLEGVESVDVKAQNIAVKILRVVWGSTRVVFPLHA